PAMSAAAASRRSSPRRAWPGSTTGGSAGAVGAATGGPASMRRPTRGGTPPSPPDPRGRGARRGAPPPAPRPCLSAGLFSPSCAGPGYIRSVTLNINETRKTAAADVTTTADAPRPLVTDVVDELSSWSPREFITAFQRWHKGELSLTHLNVLTLIQALGPQS